MTEIPEHLLRRSRERRAALGRRGWRGRGGGAGRRVRRRRPAPRPAGEAGRPGRPRPTWPWPAGPAGGRRRPGGGGGAQLHRPAEGTTQDQDPALGHARPGGHPAVGLPLPGRVRQPSEGHGVDRPRRDRRPGVPLGRLRRLPRRQRRGRRRPRAPRRPGRARPSPTSPTRSAGSRPARRRSPARSTATPDPAGWPARSGHGRDAGVRHDPDRGPDRGCRLLRAHQVRSGPRLPSGPATLAGGRVPASRRVDVLVVGGRTLRGGLRLLAGRAPATTCVLVERKHYPREKTCGDGLTPRSVRQLEDMGLGRGAGSRRPPLRRAAVARPSAARSSCAGPSHPSFPTTATSSPARTSTHLVAAPGRRRPAPTVLGGHRGGRPRSSRAGLVRGAWSVQGRPATAARRARSGPATSSSPTGPTPASAGRSAPAATGPTRWAWPSGATATSPRHDEPWIESWLDIRDKAGNVLPGYGWIFPVGDGRVNVGIGLLSTFNQWKAVNTTHLLQSFVDYAPPSWEHPARDGLRPADRRPAPDGPVGRAPRRARPSWSSATPAAPSTRSTARASPTPTRPGASPPTRWTWRSPPATAWPCGPTSSRLEDEYGLYYKVARAFVRIIGRPELMKVAGVAPACAAAA